MDKQEPVIEPKIEETQSIICKIEPCEVEVETPENVQEGVPIKTENTLENGFYFQNVEPNYLTSLPSTSAMNNSASLRYGLRATKKKSYSFLQMTSDGDTSSGEDYTDRASDKDYLPECSPAKSGKPRKQASVKKVPAMKLEKPKAKQVAAKKRKTTAPKMIVGVIHDHETGAEREKSCKLLFLRTQELLDHANKNYRCDEMKRSGIVYRYECSDEYSGKCSLAMSSYKPQNAKPQKMKVSRKKNTGAKISGAIQLKENAENKPMAKPAPEKYSGTPQKQAGEKTVAAEQSAERVKYRNIIIGINDRKTPPPKEESDEPVRQIFLTEKQLMDYVNRKTGPFY